MIRGWPWARVLFVAAVLAAAGQSAAAIAGRDVPWAALAATLAALLASIGAGVFLQGSGLFARPILGGRAARAAEGRVAITFDDGPDATHTRPILELLERGGHRGTFFVIGRRAAAEPELLAEIVRRGHALGNHSYEHAHTTPFPHPARLAADLARAQELMAQAGARVRFFRPPIGLLVAARGRGGAAHASDDRRLERDGARRARHDDGRRSGGAPDCGGAARRDPGLARRGRARRPHAGGGGGADAAARVAGGARPAQRDARRAHWDDEEKS